jgi:integral membrane protein (TIGR01906 family)
MRKSASKLLEIVTVIFISAAIVCASINLVLIYKPLYYYDIVNLNISGDCGMSYEDIRNNYSILIDYLNSSNSSKLSLPSFSMTLETETHFAEVKYILQLIKKSMYLFGVLAVAFTYMNFKNKKFFVFKYSSIILAALPLLIIPLALNFNKSFTFFHKIVFRNEFWLIDPDLDPIINIFPEAFFMHCFLVILVIIFTFSGILYSLYRINVKKFKIKSDNA